MTMKKQKPDENTIDLFWMLLRTLEVKVGRDAGPLDSELIRAGYSHLSKLTGVDQQPEFVKPAAVSKS